MNYIKQLQAEKAELLTQNEAMALLIRDFREHLQSSKFGPQCDGSRGDWIATADVLRWLDLTPY